MQPIPALPISGVSDLVYHVAIRNREPVFIWGMPGIGKSALARQLAVKHTMYLCDIRLGQWESVDLRGTPDVDRENNLSVWRVPATLPFVGNPLFPDDQPILLFLDEMNQASKPVSSVAYQLVNERAVGEHKLKPNVIVLAAGNREGDRGTTNTQPMPLSNRFTHVEMVVSVQDFCVYAARVGLPPIAIAFFQAFKDRGLLSTFDKHRDNPELGKAYATPRTWEKALKYYADATMPETVKRAAMHGAVGAGPSTEFWAFTKVWGSLVKASDIIANPRLAPVPDELSAAYATAINISGHMDPTKKKELDAFCIYLDRMRPDFKVCAWQMATARDERLIATPQYYKFCQALTETTLQ